MVFAAVHGAHLISFLLTNIDPSVPIMKSHLSAFPATVSPLAFSSHQQDFWWYVVQGPFSQKFSAEKDTTL